MLKNFYPYVFYLDCFEQSVDDHTRDIIQQINTVAASKQIILACYEWQSVENIVRMIHLITEKCSDKKIVWVFTRSFYLDHVDKIENTGVDVRFIEFDILNLYFEIYVYKTSTLNPSWNSWADKFLFLTGKPNRSNRLKLLYKMHQQGLLDRCIWSLFMSDELKQVSRNLLADLTDLQYNEFVEHCINNPDNINVLYGAGGTMHYDGYPFDHARYASTLFRVISETQMFNQPIVTEKTWTTIANHHPFMIAGYSGTGRILKRLGYKTFDEYMLYPEYDSIRHEDQRFDIILESIEHWLTNMNQFSDSMFNDIEHNYNLLTQQMIETWQQFESIYKMLDTDEFAVYQILPSPLQRAKWINFYYGIKDASWPDCFDETQFSMLPKKIQDECTTVHGYTTIL
jgi:hypothetical protein